MAVQNVMESVVQQLFTELQQRQPLHCDCEQCRDDIIALTLNQLEPRYVATAVGEIYVKALYTDVRMKNSVMKELAQAIVAVEQHPRHGLVCR